MLNRRSTYLATCSRNIVHDLFIVVELVTNIAVATTDLLLWNVDRSDVDLLLLRLLVLPLRSTEWTGDLRAHLGLRPLVEARFVDVVATCCTAPNDILTVFELHAADWTVVFHGLTIAVHGFILSDLAWQGWRIGEDLLELRGEEGVLLLEAIWSFEDVVENVDRVLAQLLFAFVGEDTHRTGAAWEV